MTSSSLQENAAFIDQSSSTRPTTGLVNGFGSYRKDASDTSLKSVMEEPNLLEEDRDIDHVSIARTASDVAEGSLRKRTKHETAPGGLHLLANGIKSATQDRHDLNGHEDTHGNSNGIGKSDRGGQKPVTLEDFELIRVLGKGCAGRVLMVRNTSSNTVQALKALSKRSVLTHSELYHTLAEVSILRRFAEYEPDNPFISALHHTFSDRENFYFVMDFYPGGDLATQMEILGILGHHRTRFYCCDIVQGLEDLHRHGIIVRDLKPENVLLDAKGHAVLADFGLSKEFPYRGDPMPMHVVTYPGQSDPPQWAGKGMGSARVMQDGRRRLVMDRAESFVGTSEYLSPEVIRRAEYSYAVDWWALGCIVVESLIGRVPFRKLDEESPIILWNKILEDPWDAVFMDPHFTKSGLDDFGLDAATWDFVNSLLIKDPMWRLTEPNVKTHEFFKDVDWELVRRGDYEHPEPLEIHAIDEDNTQYFPKLCLEEDPSVDMREHDMGYSQSSYATTTPLNDNALYALECAKYRAEIESFTWSRDLPLEEVPDGPVMAEVVNGEEMEIPALDEAGNDIHHEKKDEQEVVEVEEAPIEEPEMGEIDVIEPSTADLSDVSNFPAELEQSEEVLSTLPAPKQDPVPIRPVKSDDLSAAPRPPSLILPPRRSIESGVSSVHGLQPSPRLSREIRLPSGLPDSGLSVSDIVSIPSPFGSPARLMRRHAHLPSVDGINVARLSVEINGTITQLGDEDWEELDVPDGVESFPNGSGSTRFFTRVLKRRPSVLPPSNLRRQKQHSDAESGSAEGFSSKDGSPTKSRTGWKFASSKRSASSPTKSGAQSPRKASEGMGSTKRALEKLKVFPKLRKASTNTAANAPIEQEGLAPPMPLAEKSVNDHSASEDNEPNDAVPTHQSGTSHRDEPKGEARGEDCCAALETEPSSEDLLAHPAQPPLLPITESRDESVATFDATVQSAQASSPSADASDDVIEPKPHNAVHQMPELGQPIQPPKTPPPSSVPGPRPMTPLAESNVFNQIRSQESAISPFELSKPLDATTLASTLRLNDYSGSPLQSRPGTTRTYTDSGPGSFAPKTLRATQSISENMSWGRRMAASMTSPTRSRTGESGGPVKRNAASLFGKWASSSAGGQRASIIPGPKGGSDPNVSSVPLDQQTSNRTSIDSDVDYGSGHSRKRGGFWRRGESSVPVTPKRSRDAMGGKNVDEDAGEAPKLELKSTPPLSIEWEEI